MTEITGTSSDELTGYRVGRCGGWYVRARRGGASFDLMQPPLKSWEDVPSEFVGLTLDVTARMLGIPRGDLHEWGRG